MTQKLIIDADPGIGDALAILAAMADSSVDVIGLTAVSGVVAGTQATRNLQYLVNVADPLRHPRIGQSEVGECFADSAPSCYPSRRSLEGRHGLGDIEPLVPELHHRRDSAKLIVELVREHPQDVRILTFGPMTNIAMALDMDPQLPMLLNGIIICGGAIDCGGDVTAASEFNFWSDPEAARAVLRSPVGKILVPLDVSEKPALTFEDIDRLSGLIPSTRAGELVTGLLQFSVRATRQVLPREEIALPAAAALAVASRAARFSTTPMVVDVETTGELTSGATIVERRSFVNATANVDVLTELDESAAIDTFCRALRRIAVGTES